jgi:hypothetical protein
VLENVSEWVCIDNRVALANDSCVCPHHRGDSELVECRRFLSQERLARVPPGEIELLSQYKLADRAELRKEMICCRAVNLDILEANGSGGDSFRLGQSILP